MTWDKFSIYWLVTDILLVLTFLGLPYALWGAILITLWQVWVLTRDQIGLWEFPSQVRWAYLLLLLIAFYPPLMPWVIAAQIVGTTALLTIDYCFLARLLSLMPWNRKDPVTMTIIFKAFLSRPQSGRFSAE